MPNTPCLDSTKSIISCTRSAVGSKPNKRSVASFNTSNPALAMISATINPKYPSTLNWNMPPSNKPTAIAAVAHTSDSASCPLARKIGESIRLPMERKKKDNQIFNAIAPNITAKAVMENSTTSGCRICSTASIPNCAATTKSNMEKPMDNKYSIRP